MYCNHHSKKERSEHSLQPIKQGSMLRVLRQYDVDVDGVCRVLRRSSAVEGVAAVLLKVLVTAVDGVEIDGVEGAETVVTVSAVET